MGELIQDREDLLANLLQALYHPFVMIDVADFSILLANPAAHALGYTKGSKCFQVLHGRKTPCDSPEHSCPLMLVKRTGKPATVEHEHWDNEGNSRYYDIHVHPIQDDTGKVVRVIEYSIDVTRRKRAEEARVLMVNAIEQADVAIFMTDHDARIEFVNPAFERMTGYSSKEAVGRNPSFLQSGRHGLSFYEDLWETILSGKVWRGQIVNKKKDGSLYTEHATISPFGDATGEITKFVAVKRDITQDLKLQEQVIQSQKMEAVGMLAGGIAHDFNNLLQVIVANCELLLSDSRKAPPIREELNDILDAAMSGGELVKGLLTLGRKLKKKTGVLNLNRQIERIERLISRTLPKMIKIELALDDQVPDIEADRAQIEQIVLNLAVNARNAMLDGGKLTIRTRAKTLDEDFCRAFLDATPGTYAVLAVEDTGHGMDRLTRSRIFEPFFSSQPDSCGTGLGLAMVFSIVKHLGGFVDCQSEPGAGTTFTVYFPAAKREKSVVGTKRQAIHLGQGQIILLVEDEKRIRSMQEKILKKAGYDVISADNGRLAVEIFARESHRISLVILDLVMPEMGGRQCLVEFRQTDPNVPVLIVSGCTPPDDLLGAVGQGSCSFLRKPFDIRAFLGAVQKTINEKDA